MFLPARMKKFRAIVLDDYRDILVTELHELGVVELRSVERTELGDGIDFLMNTRAGDQGREIMSLLLKFNSILDIFKSVGKDDPDLRREKTPVESTERKDFIERARKLLSEIEGPVAHKKEDLDRIVQEMDDLDNYLEDLKNLLDVDFDLKFLGDSSYLTTVCGGIPSENIAALTEELKGCLVLSQGVEGIIPVIIAGMIEDKSAILETAAKFGFDQYNLPEAKGAPQIVAARYEQRIDELKKDKERLEGELRDIHSKHIQDLLVIRECLQLEKERIDVLAMFMNSKRTCILQGYVPKKKMATVKEILADRTGSHVVMSFEDPDNDDEGIIPVLLENPKQIRPFEMLTEMFAPPKYNEFDPTPLFSPAFIIFFGIMLTDAVYGAVVVLLGLGIIKYFKDTSQAGRDMGTVLILAGISAIIWGILFGSYFGNLFSPDGGLMNSLISIPALWLDPFSKDLYYGQSPVVVILVMALLIGFIHLNLGNFIGLKETLKKKGHIKEVFTNLWLIVFQVGLILYVLGPKTLGGLVALAGVGLLFYSEGILGFFGVTGWLGDSLSYTRLLAMGLATGGIAMAINILVDMTQGIKLIGPIIAIVIFICGHVFNIALNTLGAFIHSLRLHYVEFFGRFYEGGGEKFRPFKVEREYTEIIRGERKW